MKKGKTIDTKAKKKAGKKKPAKLSWNPEKKLTDREELFLRYYVQNDDTRFNATRSYDLAYGKKLEEQDKENAVYATRFNIRTEKEEEYCVTPSDYDRCHAVCRVEGNKLLTKPYIERRKYELLNEMLDNSIVDGELVKVIVQDTDRPSKVRAIAEYNKLGGRIVTKEQHTHQFANEDLSDAELMDRVNKQTAFFNKK